MQILQAAGTPTEPDQWCAGLPFVGVRLMTADERDALRSITGRLLGQFWTALAIMAAIASAPFLLAGYRPPNIGEWGAVIVSFIAVMGSFISTAALALRARDLWRARGRFLADLTAGTVSEFGGVVSTALRIDADQRPLIQAGVLAPGRADDQRVAVLAVTRSVVYRDTRGSWKALKVRVRTVAAAPAYAMRAPVPREVAFAADPSKQLVKRSLTAAEREEIRGYVRQVWRPRLLLLIPWVAICLILINNWLRSDAHTPLGLIAPLLLFALMAWRLRRLAILFHRTALLSRDLATGWVFALQPRSESDDGMGGSPTDSRPHEFLPNSRAPWTQNGRPASWRNLAS